MESIVFIRECFKYIVVLMLIMIFKRKINDIWAILGFLSTSPLLALWQTQFNNRGYFLTFRLFLLVITEVQPIAVFKDNVLMVNYLEILFARIKAYTFRLFLIRFLGLILGSTNIFFQQLSFFSFELLGNLVIPQHVKS